MALKNRRIAVPFEKTTANLLSHVAQQHNKSVASLVRELVLEALETREDFYLAKLAEKLDRGGAKTYSHDDVWK